MRQKSISSTELEELETLLHDEDNMAAYVQQMAMDSMLAASFSNEGAEAVTLLSQGRTSFHTGASKRHQWFWAISGAAAAIMVMIIIGNEPWNTKKSSRTADVQGEVLEEKNEPRPTITSASGVSSRDRERFLIGELLPEEVFQLGSGLLEIKTHNGSRIIIEGPASFQMKSSAALHLNHGKVCVTSPSKFKSVAVTFSENKLIRGGLSFAVHVPTDDSEPREVCSFRDTIMLNSQDDDTKIAIAENESLNLLANDTSKTVPLKQYHFFRNIPQQDLAWNSTYDINEPISWMTPDDPNFSKIISFNKDSGQPQIGSYGITAAKTLSIDVSHLVWKPGGYHAVLKWIRGTDAMIIDQIQLYHRGDLVSEDVHTGKTGTYSNTKNHIYHLDIPAENFEKNGWEIRAKVRGAMRGNGELPRETEGILHFVSKESAAATEADCVGSWEYHFDGDTYMRKFYPNHRVSLYKNGQALKAYTGKWWLREGLLYATLTPSAHVVEIHMLRDKRTLVFLDQPYNNAMKVENLTSSEK